MKRTFPFIVVLFLFTHCEKDLMPEFSSFTDQRDGNVYNTVTIGSQTWLAENLKYLPEVFEQSNDSEDLSRYYVPGYSGTDVEEAKAHPNYTTYGVTYNFRAARRACPSGWHVPDDEEWKDLTKYVGRNNGEALRSENLWSSSMTGDNSSGFNLLPSPGGVDVALWSTEQTTDVEGGVYIWGFFYWNGDKFIHDDTTPDAHAFVRCIKDE